MNDIDLKVEYTPYFNYTFYLNAYSFLQQISIENTSVNYTNLVLKISSSLGFFKLNELHIDAINVGDRFTLSKFELEIDIPFLKGLSEKDVDAVKVELVHEEKTLASKVFTLEILPIDYFGGLQSYPQLLASYVLSNNPKIYDIKNAAVHLMELNGMSVSFEGYQLQNKERVLQMVSSLYRAIQNLGLVYSALAPSFESQGQRIRLIDQVLDTKFGNCLDISLLFAACLEAVDLNPILIMTKGHSFVGVWLDDQRFDTNINYDQAAISKRIAAGTKEIAVIEATHLCRGNSLSLTDAMKDAERQIMEAHNFILSIDIKGSRANGVKPIPMLSEANGNSVGLSEIYTEEHIHDTYDIGPIYNDLLLAETKDISKQKIWERKLLDLSLRNNLLNLRFTKSMLQLVDTRVNLLEDTLSDGKTYTIQAHNQQSLLRKYNLYYGPLHHTDSLFKLAEEEFKYNKLLTYYHQDDLNAILTNLYRTSKLAEEENGRSTLYLGVGLLKWFEPKNKVQARYAPILLIPVELHRRSVNSKFTLRSREEDTMINITLLEYLKQEYKLNLDQLEQLPMDEKGVDVSKVLAIIRNAVLNLEAWDVIEQTVLGIFSFNKLLLWQDISKYSNEIQKSPIVKSLIEGKLDESLQEQTSSVVDLEKLEAQDLTLPIATDISQLNAIKNANLNKTFILHGPPGTGKSQTITNIIADALANDKRVLFVAAKKAALDVVHNRLEGIGLGPFCLELHSNKAKKSDILLQFDQALQVPKYQMSIDFLDEAKRLDDRKSSLSQYVAELHKKNKLEWSLFDTISFLENNTVQYDSSLKIATSIEDLTVPIWYNWNDWLVPYSSLVAKMGSPLKHPLSHVKMDKHHFENVSSLNNALDKYLNDYAIADLMYQQFNIVATSVFQYADVLRILKTKNVNVKLFHYFYELDKVELFETWLGINKAKNDVELKIINNFNRTILNANFDDLAISWNQAKHTWFLPKWFKRYKVKNQLSGYAKGKLNNDQAIDDLFENLPIYKDHKRNLNTDRFSSFSSIMHTYTDADMINTNLLQEDYGTIDQLDYLLKEAKVEDTELWLKTNLVDKKITHHLDKLIGVTGTLANSTHQLLQFLVVVPELAVLHQIKDNIDLLEDKINYNIYRQKAEELQLNWFLQLVEEDRVDIQNLEFEFEKILRLNHFMERLYSETTLNSFDANIYESLIAQYKTLHKDFTKISNNQLIMKLCAKIPNANMEAVQSSEIGFLQRAIRSKGRGLSIRKLFDQIPSLIPRLKPCMLMSPISVAQYFDVNTDHFDVVIFDEASQLPTSEAISSLARAKQAIIVGDPKQMPPTSFFAASKVDEENFEIEDLESILEDTLSLSIPSNYLLKHYRSKHESLISFSNKNFYDNKLMTFPSPDDLNQKVTFEYVEGYYDKGKSRTNKNEATQVIAYIKQHLESKNTKSLGVVTFSQTQQNLIEDLLQKLYQDNPAIEEFALNSEEPIFIKNLENVQGDERDIILFSIGYGPDENAKVSMNFGPLNREGGWRRLNVAITRARYEMKVFSSLRADQIDLNRTDAEGIKALKGFLYFAEKGNLEVNQNVIDAQKSSLVDAITKQLEGLGYQVKKQIGTSGYRMDIGIVHPKDRNVYILGILLDGDNYYSINNTNDRELLTPSVLKSLGWNIFRIWTLDWLKNKDRILANIEREIKTILEIEEKKKETVIIAVNEQPNEIVLETVENNSLENMHGLIEIDQADFFSSCMQAYESTKLKAIKHANAESIYYPENRTIILRQIEQIVQQEAPISLNLLTKKILKFWNVSRSGAKLNDYLYTIIQAIPSISKTEDAQVFLWSESIVPDSLTYFRDNSIEKRSIDDIASEELGIAIMEIMNNNISMLQEDLVRLTSRAFGFLKVGTQIESVISNAINKLVHGGKLDLVSGKLYIPM